MHVISNIERAGVWPRGPDSEEPSRMGSVRKVSMQNLISQNLVKGQASPNEPSNNRCLSLLKKQGLWNLVIVPFS